MSTQVGPPNVRVDGAAASSTEPAAEAPSHGIGVETLPEVSEPQSPQEEAEPRSRRKALNISGASASAPQHSEVVARGQIATRTAPNPQETPSIDTIKSTQPEQKEGHPAKSEQDSEVSGSRKSDEPEPAIVELPPTPPERHPQPPPAHPPKEPAESSSEETPANTSKTSSEQPPGALIRVPTIQIHKPSDASSIMGRALGTGVVNSTSVSPMTVPETAPPVAGVVSRATEDPPPSVETPTAPRPPPATPTVSDVPPVAVVDAAVPAQDLPFMSLGFDAGRVKKRKRFMKKVRKTFLRPRLLKILLGTENAALVSKKHDLTTDAQVSAPVNAPRPLRRSVAL